MVVSDIGHCHRCVDDGGGEVVVVVVVARWWLHGGRGCVVNTGGGVRWSCGHVDNRGGRRVVVVTSSTQAVGWSLLSMEVLG